MKYFTKKHIIAWTLNTLIFLSLTACTNMPSSTPRGTASRAAVLNIKPQQNQKIALLLPLHGRYKGPATAIRNGFLAAYDFDKKQRHTEAQVNILDTSQNAADAYQKAISEGANAVVGPLTKEDVQLIAGLPTHPVPTLALNTLDTKSVGSTQLYQLGLSPQDEAQAVAQKAHQQGYRNAIILTPNTPWGKTVAATLNQQWKAMGGNVVDQLAFSSSMQELSGEIPQLLKISTDNKQPRSGPNAKPANRRQDFDVILLAAPSNSARGIMSLLKFNYVQNIPVYATSSVYTGHPNPSYDQELNGIYFCDIPWLNPAQLPESIAEIKRHAENLWPQNYQQYPRFYALGVDAYRLISGIPNAQNGGTGYLTLDKENKLHRKLIWFQMRDGVPVAISN